ncbi:MAG: molybdopterin-dependent oxidoreductase [Ardenticatenaceae bacterium]|nr:molybdopterin-dependent oxidoreductase [Ardenticatenaceae bacterium]
MNVRTTSGWLVILLGLCAASGLLSLLSNTGTGAGLMLIHRASGVALLLLVPWKARMIARSWRRRARRGLGARRGLDLSIGLSGLSLGGLLASISLGLAWALALLPDWIAGFGPLLLHWWLGAAVLPLLLWHLLARWPRPSRYDFTGRRRALAWLGAGAVALTSGALLTRLADAAHGGEHRWSGSRHAGSFTGNAMPTTIFLDDTVQRLDPVTWRLAVRGAVARPLRLALPALAALGESATTATLDCTSGWYSAQAWGGVPLAAVLNAAGAHPGRAVVVHSATGYATLLTPGEVEGCLLATHIGGAPLAAEHGAPVRLVAPARRGWQWIKWVVAVEVV